MKEFWASIVSVMGAIALIQNLLPPELKYAIARLISKILSYLCFTTYSYIDILEIDGMNTNELYGAVQLHLSNSPSIASAKRLTVNRHKNSSFFTMTLSNNEKIADAFDGTTIWWQHTVTARPNNGTLSWRPFPDEKRGFVMCIRSSDRERILHRYLEHIMESAAEIRRKNQERLLYTNAKGIDTRNQPWESVPFKHPSTFETLAMDPEQKQAIMADLDSFAKGRDFYRSTGRAWKRGYLLYGPPGSGKSSMIAAMANHLGYDVYDLELTEVNTNADLRKLLIKTTNKSIIVIEDIDCSLNLSGAQSRSRSPVRIRGSSPAAENCRKSSAVTLSGLLNFTDGLWSCCGNERIFVITTNHLERLDPALVRSGRMDMHICMGYCNFSSLKILVKNYLGVREHRLFAELKRAVGAVQMTPADVSEILIKFRCAPERALTELLRALKSGGAGDDDRHVSDDDKDVSDDDDDVVGADVDGDEDEDEDVQEKRAVETSPCVMSRMAERCHAFEMFGDRRSAKVK